MRSMPVVNNSLHNEIDRNAMLPTIGHTKETNYNMKQREEKRKKKTYEVEIKLNHQTKKGQRRRSFILGDSNWNFFQVGYPVHTPTERSFILGDSNCIFSKVGYPVDTPTGKNGDIVKLDLNVYQHNISFISTYGIKPLLFVFGNKTVLKFFMEWFLVSNTLVFPCMVKAIFI